MIDVVSIKFKNRGKSYYFDPNGLDIKTGDKVIVETSKGLEIADCFRSVHAVEETAVVQPLRPVVRIATGEDLRVEEINKRCEKDAFGICEKKIQEHGLDMKLVDVECSFDGTKTTFFFTSDGRVDFRELVKDLASIFRNRIELRQIGVRDEAKMIGGLGICGRPYCCHQFLDDFQPVSTKMAKVQSLSLNPAKISGSCGRLMCCLRYEQEAYEDLLKRVPKQGAYVETKDGYGTAVSVNLLRSTIKVKLDKDNDDSLHVYTANEYAAVPGGRPKDGEQPPKVYVPVEEEEEEIEVPKWVLPEEPKPEEPKPEEPEHVQELVEVRRERRERPRKPAKQTGDKQREPAKVKVEAKKADKPAKSEKPAKNANHEKHAANVESEAAAEKETVHPGKNRRRKPHNGAGAPGQAANPAAGHAEKPHAEKSHGDKHHAEDKKHDGQPKARPAHAAEGDRPEGQPKHKPNHRRYYHHHGKPNQGGAKE